MGGVVEEPERTECSIQLQGCRESFIDHIGQLSKDVAQERPRAGWQHWKQDGQREHIRERLTIDKLRNPLRRGQDTGEERPDRT